MTKEKFFEKLKAGIEEKLDLGQFPESYEQACKHEVGDSLQDFIRIELEEGLEGEWEDSHEDIRAHAIRLMEQAKSDIEAAILTIEEMEA